MLTNATIVQYSIANSSLHVVLSNLTAWATNRVERSPNLADSNAWTVLWTQVSTSRTTNGFVPIGDAGFPAFYRVSSEK